MSKPKHTVPITEILLGKSVEWSKPGHHDAMDHVRKSNARIVYENEHAIAYVDDEDPRERPAAPDEMRISVSLKNAPPSLMDIDVSHGAVAVQLLYAVQQVAYKLGLHKTGFEIHANVLPPYQRRPFIQLKIRTGAHPKPKV